MQRTRGFKTKYKSTRDDTERTSMFAQSNPVRNESILFHSRRQNATEAEFGPSENRKTANWSFASRNLLCHPPHETSVLLPVNQVGNREGGYTNVCDQNFPWMTLGDSGRIALGTLRGRSKNEAIKSFRQIHRVELKFRIGICTCQAGNRHISDNRAFLLFSVLPVNLPSRCNRCDRHYTSFGIFDRMGLRG